MKKRYPNQRHWEPAMWSHDIIESIPLTHFNSQRDGGARVSTLDTTVHRNSGRLGRARPWFDVRED